MTCIYVNNKKIHLTKKGHFPSDKSTTNIYSPNTNNLNSLKKIILPFLSDDNKEDTIILKGDKDALLHLFFHLFPPVHAGGGAVLDPQGRLLMIRRRGVWDLPKGKQDENESWRNCAVREVMEETGIRDIQVINILPDTFHMYPLRGVWVCKQTHWYLMRAPHQELTPQAEEQITEVQWFNQREAFEKAKNSYASLQPVIYEALRQAGKK